MKGKSRLLVGISMLALLGLLTALFSRKKPRICPTCKWEMEKHWRFCPYDGTVLR